MPWPDPVLRSVLRLGQEPTGALEANLDAVLRAQPDIADTLGVDAVIVGFLADLRVKAGALPSYTLVHQHFRDQGDQGDGVAMAAATRLELLTAAPPALLTEADLHYAIGQYRDDVLAQRLGQVLVQASTILSSGIDQKVVQNGQRITQRLQGPQAAFSYLHTELGTLARASGDGPAEGDVATDSEKVWVLYETRRDNPIKTGILSGIRQIDDVHRGLRNGELALVLGYTSHMKTTLVLSWALKAATRQGKNVGIVSLETPLEDLRVLLAVMHATHPKFTDDLAYLTITVDGVLHGTLNREQERFFRRVVEDLKHCPDYGRLSYREPSVGMTIEDIRRWAEQEHRRAALDLLVIDYLSLVSPPPTVRAADTPSRINEVIRGAKLLAMGFAAGRGLPVLSPFAANREGWKNAEKNGGHYRLTDFAWANEAEKSADLIYEVWLDEMLRGSKELQLGNLKTRIVPLIPATFRVFADPTTRLIDDLDLAQPAQAPVEL